MTEDLDLGEFAHWIAAPMRNVGTVEQFHAVVERAERLLEIAALSGMEGLAMERAGLQITEEENG